MLALVAVGSIILLGVVLFLVLYLQMLRSGSEQQTAIDSAAIAAAKDISRIVINTEEFGYVGLTTAAPSGEDTKAPDDWYQEVRSLNELMATARLDLIIASEMGDTFMKNLALADLSNVKKVKDDLATEINRSIQSGGSARDAAGNVVTPYLSAERVYLKNASRGSTYVPGSMKLTMGGVEGGIETGTPCPTPLSKGACAANESNGRYLSDRNVPFDGNDFVFGSVARRVSLCEKSKYKEVVPGLPFQMPSVVKVEAQQEFKDQGKTWTVSFSACACAGSAEPPRPAAGAFTLSFPDGPVTGFNKPGDIWGSALIQTKTMDVYQSQGGDFIVDKPPAELVPYEGAIPFTSNPPPATEVIKLALYDWLRCGGSKVNIDAAVGLEGRAFNPPSVPKVSWKAPDPSNPAIIQTLGQIPTGVMHIYTFNPDGTIAYVSKDIKPYPYTVVGENQLYAELSEGNDIATTEPVWNLSGIKYLDVSGSIKTGEIQGTNLYDIYVRDLSRHVGTISGGKHAGERLDGNPHVSWRRDGVVDWSRRESGTREIARMQQNVIALADNPDFGMIEAQGEIVGPVTGVVGGVTGVVSSLLSGPGGTNGTSTGSPGRGSPNMISRQDDFASSSVPPPTYSRYSQGPGGGGPRPAYSRNGVSADIRFRRQLKVGDLAFMLGGYQIGYVGEMLD